MKTMTWWTQMSPPPCFRTWSATPWSERQRHHWMRRLQSFQSFHLILMSCGQWTVEQLVPRPVFILEHSHCCVRRGCCFLPPDGQEHHCHEDLHHHLHHVQHLAHLVSSSLTPWLILLAPSTANMTGTQSWPAANSVDGPTWPRWSK